MSTAVAAPQQQIFGQPIGLATLFFTELWERLSYYGMRALLVLFMVDAIETGGFGMTDATAGAIYGIYTASVYLASLPGGWVADRLIGQQNAVFVGGCVIAAGHFTMAAPLVPGLETFEYSSFFLGLALIVIGTGLLKPNVSALVGGLYPGKDERRDAGFSIFYMGINIGAFLGPLICGYLGEQVDWHLGFSAAGFGMLGGLVVFKYGQKWLGNVGTLEETPETQVTRRKDWRRLAAGSVAFVAAIGMVAWLMTSFGLSLDGLAQSLGVGIVLLAIVYFIYLIVAGGLTSRQKKRVGVIFLLFLGAAMFWSGFEQAGTSMNLFAERYTDRMLGSWELPASWLQSVNPIFLIIFAPLFGVLWLQLGSRQPSIPVKFGLGLVLLGLGFFVMSWGSTFIDLNGDGVSPMWLVMAYFLHTAGELCLSPVGLSSVTKLSPPHLVGQMMGIWFMGSALGNLIAGIVGGRIETMPMPTLFAIVASIACVAGVAFFVFSFLINRLIGDLRQDDGLDQVPMEPIDEAI
ncbi:MAG: peptide MFS transporter [Acidobacteriota bacterium]